MMLGMGPSLINGRNVYLHVSTLHIAPHPSLLGHKMGNVNHDERRQQLWIGWKDKARTNDELGPTMKLFHLESCDFFFSFLGKLGLLLYQ